jgi:hypothetical protein
MLVGVCYFCNVTFRKREQKYKFCSIVCANRANRNRLQQIALPSHTADLAEFIGICLGDGYVSSYQTAITLNATADKDYIPYVARLINSLFPNTTICFVKRKDNAVDVRISSKVVAEFIKSNGIVAKAKYIPVWIQSNNEFRKACTKGLFDTEGSISFKTYLSKNRLSIYKQLNFRNIDDKLMLFVRNTLIDLGLKPTMTLKRSLYLSNNASIDLYRAEVGFGNPKLRRRSLVYDKQDYENLKFSIS